MILTPKSNRGIRSHGKTNGVFLLCAGQAALTFVSTDKGRRKLANSKNLVYTPTFLSYKQGNTFVYLLNRRAAIRRIIKNSGEDIDVLKKASELILEDDEECGKGEEHMLEIHLLEFGGVLEESCLCVMSHILLGLSLSTLLLCEATAVVMEKCFHLLGITPELSMLLRSQSSAKQPMDVNAPVAIEVATGTLEAGYFEDRCIIPSSVSVARDYALKRDQSRNSRFEMVSIRPAITPDSMIEKGRLFGVIAVSNKYGLLSDGASHLCEPDFAYVPLFVLDWRHAINMCSGGVLFLGEGGIARLHYILLKDAVDAVLKKMVEATSKFHNLLKIGILVWGKLIQKLCQKGVYEESFSKHAAWSGEKFI
nr:arginine--tRNA ligase, chloroplastic/mitochondrial [Tanacetum cinerariifolium]